MVGVIDEKGNEESAMIKRHKTRGNRSEDKVAHWCGVINNAKRQGRDDKRPNKTMLHRRQLNRDSILSISVCR